MKPAAAVSIGSSRAGKAESLYLSRPKPTWADRPILQLFLLLAMRRRRCLQRQYYYFFPLPQEFNIDTSPRDTIAPARENLRMRTH